ncbi:MAG: type II secretion system F family protein [Acidobacteriaceae bacterium]
MAEYLIRVADERGSVQERVEAAASSAEVRDRFAQQGYHVFSVKERGLLSGGEARFGKRRIKLEDFILFNQQFVTLIRAGLPILTSLDLLSKRQRSEMLKGVIGSVSERVKNGESLSQAFAAQRSKVVSNIYTTTLLAGEKSGNLEEVLSRYISFQRVALSFRKKLKASLLYPLLLVTAILIMFVFLITYVVPQFGSLYSTLHVQLPASTEFLLEVGKQSRYWVPILIASIILIVFVAMRWSRSNTGALQLDRFRLNFPIFGNIYEKYQVAAFSRMLSTLLAGGIPLVQALETAGTSLTSPTLAQTARESAVRVREGRSLAKSLSQGRFPDLAIEMIEVGESTGALPAMLNSISDFFEEDVQTALTAALSLIEPAILILMGIVVAFVLISLYLPIFSIGSAATTPGG